MLKKITLLRRVLNNINRTINPEKQFYVDLFISNEDWNSKGANYEEGLRWKLIRGFILHCLESNKESDNKCMEILDIGCGRGWLTNLLSEFGMAKGLEPVQKVAKYAKKLFPHLDISAGTTKTILQTHKNIFDIIVCSEVIEHIPDNKKNDFAKDLSLLSKNNGFLIVTTPRKEAEPEWKKYQDPRQPIEDWMTEKELENLFINSGWKKVSLERFSIQPSKDAPNVEIYQLWLFQRLI